VTTPTGVINQARLLIRLTPFKVEGLNENASWDKAGLWEKEATWADSGRPSKKNK
jgi:hypothetical protein